MLIVIGASGTVKQIFDQPVRVKPLPFGEVGLSPRGHHHAERDDNKAREVDLRKVWYLQDNFPSAGPAG